jgi:hypothetical protein
MEYIDSLCSQERKIIIEAQKSLTRRLINEHTFQDEPPVPKPLDGVAQQLVQGYQQLTRNLLEPT